MSTTTHRHSATAQPPPTISLPPRPSLDSFFSSAGISPGPMTLVSSFFADDSPSFSQLLAGAMASPLAFPPPSKEPNHHHDDHDGDGGDDRDDGSHYSHKNIVVGVGNGGGGFKQSRPMNLVVARSPLFTVPPGLSPSGFLNSPGFFSLSPQSPFGMSHQQALAQVTAQAVLAQSHIQMQADYQPPAVTTMDESSDHLLPFTQNDAADKNSAPYVSETQSAQPEASEITHVDKKFQQPSLAMDKPADDGYNWRKYGQKQVKGSEYPRSYYKCTHLNCPVKKKVERALGGHITEIIYKGQHNHEKPQANRRTKDNNDSNENAASIQPKSESNSQGWAGNSNNLGESLPDCSMLESDQAFNQGAPRQLPGSNESEDVVDVDIREEEGDDSEPNPKRRNTNPVVSEVHQRTVTEPKIIVQTRSKVDLLDDGYRWRKYGQKVVKGNPHPRSYYKCTSAGCSVRKHVERASTDPNAVITTYEGKHNHDVPASRNSSQNTAASASMPLKPHNVVPEKHPLLKDVDFGNDDQSPIHLRLKEEQIMV